jgi:sugar/nucleoside kinase (ribokinase family)
MFDVITIGSAVRDVFLLSKQFQLIPSKKFASGVGECVPLGDKIEIEEIVYATGGGATNAAVTFARLGYRVAAACRVGDDIPGRELVAELERDGVDVSLVSRDATGSTGYSVLLTADTGERTALVYRGVSGSFTVKDMPSASCKTKWIYLTSIGGNLALVKKLLARGMKDGINFAWNPGKKEIVKGLEAIRPLLRSVAVFNVNREEAETLTEKKDLAAIFKALAVNPRIVVIVTDGPNGSYVHRDGTTLFAPGTGAKAKSQTGAGDAFGSAFVASYMRDGNLRLALATGVHNAESVIKQVGAKAGILGRWPTKKQIESIKITTV